jgi:transcriptional regulator with PAS, ATPase and Fis domain
MQETNFDPTEGMLAEASTRSERLAVFRIALSRGHDDIAVALAAELGAEIDAAKRRTPVDVRCLHAAATAPFPFGEDSLPVPWRFVTRNRLGRWSQEGDAPPLSNEQLDDALAKGAADWMRCSDRELFFAEGSSSWPEESRDALAAIVRTRSENARLHRVIEQQDRADEPQTRATEVEGIVGDAPVMREVYDRILRVAPRDVVLILGASGTGKELAARAIHRHSLRRSRTFTAINCAALPENLIESELFGHVRGAFTGADRDRAGLVETTDGGTLFLDEIGEMPLPAQAKLLRFLQEKEFRRVGETVNRTADVRIVCATNRNLEESVEAGEFREDLFYRVHGVDVALPPLRERGGDILKLAAHFLEIERAQHRAGPSRLSDEVEAAFLAYAWPGNVRELQNTIRAAHAVSGDARELTLDSLPQRVRVPDGRRTPTGSYQDAVARFRRELIERSLDEARGNQNRAASMLQISRQALAYQIRELGIVVRKSARGPQATDA